MIPTDRLVTTDIPPASPGSTGRWYLHRAGILNVWQYDRTELLFAGGRGLLRGKNGAGKSKALEMLLPFLLDGDTRRLDSTGRDRTTIRWLMTADRDPGNHVGYVWLELRLVSDEDGPDAGRYLTLGAGLRGSSSTGTSDHWFFVTDRRVGVDLGLDVDGECLSADRLREEIGDAAVYESGAEHRRRVGRLLFGLTDEARYRNLIHLLHRLRDPNIGNRVEEGELAGILTDALPPPDDHAIHQAAGRFEDLETVREQVERSQQTADALNGFLEVYRAYSRAALRQLVDTVAENDRSRAKAAKRAKQLAQELAEAAEEKEHANQKRHDLEQELSLDRAEIRALEQSEAYRAHADLVDRQETVSALERHAEDAREHARELGEVADTAEEEVRSRSQEADNHRRNTATATKAAGEALAGTGLDAALIGTPPDKTSSTARTLDHAEASDRAANAAEAVKARRRSASRLRDVADNAAAARDQALSAEERAAESEAHLDEASEHHRAAQIQLEEAARTWSDAVSDWMGDTIAARVDWKAVLSALESFTMDTEWADSVQTAAIEALHEPLQRARDEAARTEVAAREAASAASEADARLSGLEASSDARPEPARHGRAERDGSLGTPFYELVDFSDHVPAAQRRGIEAALEASGILDAWVSADGSVINPFTEDVLLRSDLPAVAGATLADLLTPATPGSPVSEAVVAHLLTSVAVGETDASTWVTTEGRWSIGALRGAWSKPEVEYVGAGTREATRQRRIEEARREAAERRDEAERAESAAREARLRSDLLDDQGTAFPSRREHDEALVGLTAAADRLDEASRRHNDDLSRAHSARSEAVRATADAEREAARAGLPTDVAEIDQIIGLLRLADLAIERWEEQLHLLAESIDRLERQEAAAAERRASAQDAEARARERQSAHERALHQLAALREAIGEEVDQTMARLDALTTRTKALEEVEIPQAKDNAEEAIGREARISADHNHAVQEETSNQQDVVDAGRHLGAALGLPGLTLAAFDQDRASAADLLGRDFTASSHRDVSDLARALEPLIVGEDASDSLLLSRYDQLQPALAGGYDTAMEESAAIKVIHVADDSGRRPLAVVAAQLTTEAEQARRRFASQEEEVVERFLVREVADEVRGRLLDASDLVAQANATLADVRSSHGKGVHLDWKIDDDAPESAATAARLLVDTLRSDEDEAELRAALLRLIDIERIADPSAGYEVHLRSALDYRKWYRFTVEVTDDARPGSRRKLSNRLGLSQGEQRVLSYLALFAAASAQYDAIARQTPEAPRLLLLDDAFAKVDEPTHAQLLGHLVQLDLDFLITSERLWGCFPAVPSLEIYEAVRDPAVPGIALLHFHWDGRQRHLRGM